MPFHHVFSCVSIISEASAVCPGDSAEKHKNTNSASKTQKPQQYIWSVWTKSECHDHIRSPQKNSKENEFFRNITIFMIMKLIYDGYISPSSHDCYAKGLFKLWSIYLYIICSICWTAFKMISIIYLFFLNHCIAKLFNYNTERNYNRESPENWVYITILSLNLVILFISQFWSLNLVCLNLIILSLNCALLSLNLVILSWNIVILSLKLAILSWNLAIPF